MFKLVYFVRAKRGVEDFRRGWREKHGPLVGTLAQTLGMYRYIQNHPIVGTGNSESEEIGIYRKMRSFEMGADIHDVVDEYYFNGSPDVLLSKLNSAEVAEALNGLVQSEARYADFERSTLRMVIEIPQINPFDDSIVAHPNNRIIKLLSTGAGGGADYAAISHHLLVNHGPLIRKWAPLMGLKRYIQHHPMRHALAENLSDLRGLKGGDYNGVTMAWADAADAILWGSDPRMVAAHKEIIADEGNMVGDRSVLVSYVKEYAFFRLGYFNVAHAKLIVLNVVWRMSGEPIIAEIWATG